MLEFLLCDEHQFPTILVSSKIPELVAITSWYLRWERGQATHGENVKDLAAIGANSPKPKMRTMGWTKPLENFVKFNVDASFDADDL
jgi:hypothetical protein